MHIGRMEAKEERKETTFSIEHLFEFIALLDRLFREVLKEISRKRQVEKERKERGEGTRGLDSFSRIHPSSLVLSKMRCKEDIRKRGK
jgi:hypothetical protein